MTGAVIFFDVMFLVVGIGLGLWARPKLDRLMKA